MALKTYQVYVLLLFLFVGFQTLTVQSKKLRSSTKFVEYLNNLVRVKEDHSITSIQDVKILLKTYGYYIPDQNINLSNDEFDDHLRYAIEEYQKFYNINVTGMLDSYTIKQMMMSRCGVADLIHEKKTIKKFRNHSSSFVSKYSYRGRKWPPSITNLIYTIKTRPANIDSQTLVSVLASSFQKWAKVSQFTFKYVQLDLRANIVIGFYSGDHGDGMPFDGHGNEVAHAFFPPDGRLHFDNDENWSTRSNSDQLDLESVSVHEIGHILGLGHSNDPNSVMYPTFKRGTIKRDLSTDDIVGIRTLYSS